MEDVHQLNYYGKYSFADIMQMVRRERSWLLERLLKQYDQEAKSLKKKGLLEET